MNHRHLVLNEDSKFAFHCHDGLECFKTCCRDINIYLSPYDVLRMKNFLNLSSEDFLKEYTLKVQVPNTGLTIVQIDMSKDNKLRCPFITPKGCQVYQERPWSCRMAPVDMLGGGKYSFIFESSHCHGLNETKTQTVKDWLQDQGLGIYEETEQGFNEIPNHLKLTGNPETDEKLKQLFFMACYDLDRFRTLLLNNPSLFEELSLDQEAIDEIKHNDVQLMKFGFKLLCLGSKPLTNLTINGIN
ncbi:YkgJ family cysteine cluster protein [Desulfosporosinus hippei]|uniref:Uncharacterized protein n=1 Tax=Desulfosporosinus hippei DSM 8344 TaxID=1121419 RepID=A0A1G8J3X6_9FIRM|nr:YkgJ family cysteine cluster protein [Desulfosporosinus hippei]SDI25924.1 hypothetical protein SAMN05443529_13114 [Desulfosporosinus hippei DSM 8344]